MSTQITAYSRHEFVRDFGLVAESSHIGDYLDPQESLIHVDAENVNTDEVEAARENVRAFINGDLASLHPWDMAASGEYPAMPKRFVIIN